MTRSFLSRTSLFAATLLAAGAGLCLEADAQLNLGPRFDRALTLSSPPGRSLRGLPDPVTRPDRRQRTAQADCSSAAAEAAADSGGQVLSVSSRQQNGRTVCVVTVLIPAEEGGRPRKKTITIPQ